MFLNAVGLNFTPPSKEEHESLIQITIEKKAN